MASPDFGFESLSADVTPLMKASEELCASSKVFCRKKKGGGSLLGWFAGSGQGGESATRASLGGACSMYYDETKQRWRERGNERCDDSAALTPPPRSALYSGPASASASPTTEMGNLEQILRHAGINGSFEESAGLLRLLKLSDELCSSWVQELGAHAPPRKTLFSAIVLAYLRIHFAERKTTWDMLARKTCSWLQAQKECFSAGAFTDAEMLISAAIAKLQGHVL